MLGGSAWKTVTPSLLPADVMALRTSGKQHKKLELGESGSAVLQEKPVMEGPLWELISPLLAPEKPRAAVKEWNKGSKYGPYGELFLFLMRKEPYATSGNFVSTPSEGHEFMRDVEQGSGRLREYEFAHDSGSAWTRIGTKMWSGR